MKTFVLRRLVDVSGVSGTGIVAEGVMFHDGQCVLSWFGKVHSLEFFLNADNILEIHGHHGLTSIEWSN